MIKDMRKIVKEGYEKGDYAGTFRISDKPNKMEESFLKKLLKLLPKNPHILDFGCGIGVPFDKYLVEHGCKLTGIDIAQNHIEQAKKNVPSASFIKDDFSKKDFGNERFNAIIAMYSIFHIPREEQDALFEKMNSLLAENGIILVTLGTSGGEGIDEDWCGARMVWSNYSLEKYKTIIAQAGFDIVINEFEGKPGDEEYHWWIIGKKN